LGSVNPSPQDKDLTERIYHIAKLFSIEVLNHLVILESRYFSYSEDGELD